MFENPDSSPRFVVEPTLTVVETQRGSSWHRWALSFPAEDHRGDANRAQVVDDRLDRFAVAGRGGKSSAEVQIGRREVVGVPRA